MAPASYVAPIDKLSVALVIVLAAVFLGEVSLAEDDHRRRVSGGGSDRVGVGVKGHSHHWRALSVSDGSLPSDLPSLTHRARLDLESSCHWPHAWIENLRPRRRTFALIAESNPAERRLDRWLPHVFSAVSKEFHEKDPRRPQAFSSYREVLARSLRILTKESVVVSQEDLEQGPGDLLGTLDEEIARCNVVVHLIGDMAGAVPTSAEFRRLRERHAEFLVHEPELQQEIGDGQEITYTQWEAYLAYQHRVGRFVYKLSESAPRSPSFSRDETQRASQERHFARLEAVGEHYIANCHDQLDLARKVVTSIERFGLRADGEPPVGEEVEFTPEEAAAITSAVGVALRSSAKHANSDYDPAGIGALLKALDDATLVKLKAASGKELHRPAVLRAMQQHQLELEQSYSEAPTFETKYEIALAQLAMAHYLEVRLVAEKLADEEVELCRNHEFERHRSRAVNAYMLMHDGLQLAGRRSDAIRAMEKAGELVDFENEPPSVGGRA